jgi:hypothetical protein
MTQLGYTPLSSPARKSPAMNPFARALADAEREKQGSMAMPPGATQDSSSLFSDALARSGGSFTDTQQPSNDWAAEQQRQVEAQQKKEALRRKLHDQINPVDSVDIFSAREQQVKREIDQLRQELRLLVVDVASFHKEVELTLMTEVVDPGQSGTYYLTFFQRLRSFIMLLRQKISSAKTWATQLHGKSSKKKQRNGLVVGGLDHEKTSTIQDMMHHERSSQYSGG